MSLSVDCKWNGIKAVFKRTADSSSVSLRTRSSQISKRRVETRVKDRAKSSILFIRWNRMWRLAGSYLTRRDGVRRALGATDAVCAAAARSRPGRGATANCAATSATTHLLSTTPTAPTPLQPSLYPLTCTGVSAYRHPAAPQTGRPAALPRARPPVSAVWINAFLWFRMPYGGTPSRTIFKPLPFEFCCRLYILYIFFCC